MWPFKHKTKEVSYQLILQCPPQQLASKRCVCMACKKRGVCWTEKLVASNNNCENVWISACSLSVNKKEDAMFDAVFGGFYEMLGGRHN